MINKDIIIIAGSPGSGKTTLSESLQKELDSPLIDFGKLREFHLDRAWEKVTQKEKDMSFGNLIYIIKNYLKNGYENIIINDLSEYMVNELWQIFSDTDLSIITLVVSDENELESRISTRKDGFKDFTAARDWNKRLLQKTLLPNESKIDTSELDQTETFMEVIKGLSTN